jgi:superfamily II DNA or RNA helicase
VVVFRVNNIFTDIEGDLSFSDYQELERLMSFFPDGYQFSPMYNKWILDDKGKRVRRIWDGRRRQIWKNKKRTYFPTGLYSIAREYLLSKKVQISTIDCRFRPEKNIFLTINPEIIIRDYQEHDVITPAVTQQRGIIQCATGAGKTLCAAVIIQRLAVSPFIFFVTSIDLLLQAKRELQHILRQNGEPLIVGQIGGGIVDIREINVMTIQTAVRSVGEEWNKNTKFDDDDEDADDKTPIEARREEILKLLKTAKGVFCDECVSGDAEVITKNGLVPMKELDKFIGKDILSFSGNSAVWRKITHFYSKGKKKTLTITLENGNKIKCTEDHPIMTKHGWKSAVAIHLEDQILCCANADVDSKFPSKEKAPANIPNISLGIKSKNVQCKNGKKSLAKQLKLPRFANVGVKNKLSYTQELLNRLLNVEEIQNTIGFATDMINDHLNGTYNYLNAKNKQYSGHFLETLVFPSLLKEARIQGSMAIMAYVNLNGRNLNQLFSIDYPQNIGNTPMEVMENNQLRTELVVIQNLKKYMTQFLLKIENESPPNGLIVLEKSAWHGGYVTMDRETKATSLYIQKDSQKKKFISLLNGSQKNMDQLQYMKQRRNILPFISKKKQETKLFERSRDTSHNVCDIKYVKISSISLSVEEEVFDITVEGTHCFFANNILVHNCQHWRAETCQLIARNLDQAYYTLAGSATPYRDSGDDLMIQACFGKKIAEISASKLIRKNWLIKPQIKILHIKKPKSQFRQWQQLYKEQITDNIEYNQMVANLANAYIQEGRTVLVLFQQIKHGKLLTSLIPGSEFLAGSSTKKKREEKIQELREKKIACICGSTILDEGVDVRVLDTLILAGGGKSKTRALQRIGRILRPYPGKATATVIDFRIHQKYLKEHSIAREKIYKTEPEFEIEHIVL